MAADWTSLNRAILDGLDVEGEYKTLGVRTAGRPSGKGWLSCHVYGVDDRDPSAGINVGDEHPARGRYKEFTGEARNVSLFAFASEVAGKFGTWQEARAHYAKLAGVKLPGGKQKTPPIDQFAWRPWNDQIVRGWCHHKPPITVEAVRLAGGRVAGWPRDSQKYTVIVLPIFGANGLDDDPTGYVFWNRSGRPLLQWQGKDQPPKPKKMLVAGGSVGGWVNAAGLAAAEKAKVVWLMEGPRDCLMLQSLILQSGQQDTHTVLTNSNGSKQVLGHDFLSILAGKSVHVVHDCDIDGEEGAKRWAAAVVPIADRVKIVQLPFPVTEKHGKDGSDWTLE